MKTLILALALAVGAVSAQAATLKIAAVTGTAGACHGLPVGAPAGQKAYYKHLAARLGRDIQECPVATEATAAQAVAAGSVDIAVLDPAAFAPVRAQTRAILTLRPTGTLNRIPVLAVTKAGASRADIAALRGAKVVYAGSTPAALGVPRRAVVDQGAGPGFFALEDVAADADAAVAKLRSGADDALIINAGSWQRLCQGEHAKENRCTDLKVIWRGRPRATKAMVIRRDMPDELRFRLIGIHVALHLEDKPAFAWASSWIPQGAEFEPTEADALALAAR
jgi:ABC-type phosphate/phosphonate transport system substrate-binding protein